jgi:dihydrofolate reductase
MTGSVEPEIALVVAADAEGGIGRDGGLPWRLPADLRFFKRVTMGRPLVMGRKTHESIGRSLPGRLNVVVTRDPGYRPYPGAVTAATLDAALARAAQAAAGGPVMVIGGTEIFRAALGRADRIYLTRVHGRFDADTVLPPLDPAQWREVRREDHAADAENPHPYSFCELVRA